MISDISAFIEKIDGAACPVDLMKIGQQFAMQQLNAASNKHKYNSNPIIGKFRIALDMEQCMDRWYGGYYSDWACGGQWNRTLQFCQLLVSAFQGAHIEIIAFFDGTLMDGRKLTQERNEYRQRCISVLKHIRMIATPPPKIWWLPPSGIKTCLRNALRSLNIQVVQTVHNHTQEIIDAFHEHKLNAILGLHPDYIVANISRYFSSHDLRLSYRGNLETKEYVVQKMLASLKLSQDQLAILAALLGGHILIDDVTLKQIYQKLNIEYNSDYEGRIRKLADLIRGESTGNLDEFLKKLNLAEFATNLKATVDYYQGKGKKPTNNNNVSLKQKITEILVEDVKKLSIAGAATDAEEVEKKNMSEDAVEKSGPSKATGATPKQPNKAKNEKKSVKFVYTLPGEVVRTALQRHQRGIMDSRVYILLTKREIMLPQVLEDETYREIPPVHLFYRPARQMIYAILFNLYHQKYMCSKSVEEEGGKAPVGKKPQPGQTPDVKISEWVWSPQNEFSKPEPVAAQCLNWAVPTVQRLWFGTNFEDKQRRMRAFLTVMRSDSQLMLNRSYVPQHMLVMACVLRYIVTSPDRNILTRSELDAFMATAFSPHLLNVENTQEMVLPGVHLRGVYLATLFMQGVETAQLANDVCGVPLPWMMTNPWLFFDGKLFHLKLKMAACVSSLRELCDDQIESVIKIERFRKAVLEDVEHYLLPAHIDPLYRPGFFGSPPQMGQGAYKQNNSVHPLSSLSGSLMGNGGGGGGNGGNFGSYGSYGPQSYYNTSPQGNGGANRGPQQLPQQANGKKIPRNGRSNYHQLKVGGVVVGSWADVGVPNRGNMMGNPGRMAIRPAGMLRFPIGRGRPAAFRTQHQAARLQIGPPSTPAMSRAIARNYQPKQNRFNKQRKSKAKKDKKQKTDAAKKLAENGGVKTEDASDDSDDEADDDEEQSNVNAGEVGTELQNGITVLASDLAKTMCDKILKDEEEELPVLPVTESKDNTADVVGATANGTTSPNQSTIPSANPHTNNKNKNKKAKKLAKNSMSSDGGSGVDADTNGKDDTATDAAATIKG